MIVDQKRYSAVLGSFERMARVRELIHQLGRDGVIPIPSDDELTDLRAVMFFNFRFCRFQYAITPDEVFIWGHDEDPIFSSNWNRFREAALKF